MWRSKPVAIIFSSVYYNLVVQSNRWPMTYTVVYDVPVVRYVISTWPNLKEIEKGTSGPVNF